jgi:hypothetical protein
MSTYPERPLHAVIWEGGMLLTTDGLWVVEELVQGGAMSVVLISLTSFGELHRSHSWMEWTRRGENDTKDQ